MSKRSDTIIRVEVVLALLGICLSAPQAARAQASLPGTPPIGGNSSLSQSGSNNNARVSRSPGSSGVVAVPEDFSSLKLASGFLLSLTVYDMPEISCDLRVDGAGNVEVPLSGSLHVAGLTVSEAKTAIQKKLMDARILKNPQLNLDVVQYAGENVTVFGEVQAPGRVQLLAPHSLADVLGMVGGETQLAGDTIEIRRIVNGNAAEVQLVHYARGGPSDQINAITILPGDTISVPRAGIVYVMGAVNRPGGYVMQEDGKLNVSQALSLAYGTTLNASVGSIRVIRKDAQGKLTEIPIPYGAITKGKAAPLTLQAEDMVYVPVSKIKTVFSSGMGIMSSTTSALIYTTR